MNKIQSTAKAPFSLVLFFACILISPIQAMEETSDHLKHRHLQLSVDTSPTPAIAAVKEADAPPAIGTPRAGTPRSTMRQRINAAYQELKSHIGAAPAPMPARTAAAVPDADVAYEERESTYVSLTHRHITDYTGGRPKEGDTRFVLEELAKRRQAIFVLHIGNNPYHTLRGFGAFRPLAPDLPYPLRELDISYTNLTELPPEIQDFIALEKLVFNDTNVSAIPDWIGKLVELKTLSFSLSLVEDPLPISMKFLQKLENIFFVNTPLSRKSLAVSQFLINRLHLPIRIFAGYYAEERIRDRSST